MTDYLFILWFGVVDQRLKTSFLQETINVSQDFISSGDATLPEPVAPAPDGQRVISAETSQTNLASSGVTERSNESGTVEIMV
jgi:hypothetical protein